MRILLHDYFNSGWVAYDDVEVYQIVGGARSGANLIPNPGFETTSGWSETPSSVFPATSIWRGNWGTAAPHSGTYAYSISNQAYGQLNSAMIPAISGAQYDLYAYVRGAIDADENSRG